MSDKGKTTKDMETPRGFRRTRVPVKCPECGAKSVFVPCYSCGLEAAKERERAEKKLKM
jgi:hypothetical protein